MTTTSTARKRALAAAIRANVPTIMWGDPGEGKTAENVADATAWGFTCEVVVGSIRESADFLGLPIEREDEVRYAPLAWAKRLAAAPKGLLYLDELNTAAPTTMKAMLRVLQERWVGDFQLPESVAIIAAANPPSIAVDGWDLPAPIANRFMHLDWQSDLDDWFDGVATDFQFYEPPTLDSMLGEGSDADKARVRGAVIAFLRTRRDMVKKIPDNPDQAGKGWASRRSWTNAMAILAELRPDDDDAALLVLKGCVGEAGAIEYLAWLASADLYDPAEVLDKPSIVKWRDDRPDRLFALMTSIRAYVQVKGDAETFQKGIAVFTACAKNGKPDVAMPGARELLNNMPQGAKIKPETVEAFSDIFQRTGQWAAAS